MKRGVAILGIFVADLAFRAGRQPVLGETLMGSSFKMGPGGKGSNQAVAAARAGAQVSFLSRLGKDAFGDIALATWRAEGIVPHVTLSADEPTGAAAGYETATMSANPAWMRSSRRSGSGMIPASVAMPMLTWPL